MASTINVTCISDENPDEPVTIPVNPKELPNKAYIHFTHQISNPSVASLNFQRAVAYPNADAARQGGKLGFNNGRLLDNALPLNDPENAVADGETIVFFVNNDPA